MCCSERHTGPGDPAKSLFASWYKNRVDFKVGPLKVEGCISEVSSCLACTKFQLPSPRVVGEMAQWVKRLAAKPEDLSSVPGPHTVKGENLFL